MVNNSFIRNLGIISNAQQLILKKSTIGIAGVGTDGGMTAERLTRAGIGGLKIADPESFEQSNINRQYGSDTTTLGKNKARVIKSLLKKINPDLSIRAYPDGINENNVNDFILGCDLIIDEIEYSRLDLSVLLHRAARKANKRILLALNIGWGANLFIFNPKGMTLEEYCGLPHNSTLDDIRRFPLPLNRFCPTIPKYIPNQVVRNVIEGNAIPSISPACTLVASIVSTESILMLVDKKRDIQYAPKYIEVDLYGRKLIVKNNNQTS